MTTPPPDEHVTGSGAPSAELERRPERGDGSRAGAHALRVEVHPVAAPRHPQHDRLRYYLSCLEPSGDFDEVIVAVTDAGRRRYFATRDGERLVEVDEDAFERRSESGTRSMLELDERELGELEAELQFVRPVRGRDPVAEAAASDAAGPADDSVPSEPDAPEPPEQPLEPPAPVTEDPTDEATDEVTDHEHDEDDEDWIMEEFEAEMTATTTDPMEPIERIERFDARAYERPAVAASVSPAVLRQDSPTPEAVAVAQVALARGIAFVAHRGKLDKSGLPYVDHPGRVAERFDIVAEPVEAAAAWLHDVLEDTPITAQELLEAGVLPEIVDVVHLLTRTADVSPDEYYARIRLHPSALAVKLADIDDNTAPWRLRRLSYGTQVRLAGKYAHARRALGIGD